MNEWSDETKQKFQGFLDGLAAKHAKHDEERAAVKGEDMVFIVDPYEQLTLSTWIKEHKCKYRHISLTYKFTNTGIGVATVVECRCGEEVNITDYEMW